MTKKFWFILAAAVALGFVSLYLNTDLFRNDNIQIYHRARPARMGLFGRKARPGTTQTIPVFFGFDRKLRLNEIKVVNVAEFETNKYAHPLWHLVTSSNSLPTKGFAYGLPVPGMRSYFTNAAPDPLLPGVKYRLLVQADGHTAQHDFTLQPQPQ